MQEKNLQQMFQIQDMAGNRNSMGKIIADSAKTGMSYPPLIVTCRGRGVVTLLVRFIGKRLTQICSYLQYNSHHPVHVVKSLFDSAARVTSQQEDLHAEEEHLRGALKMKWLP